MVHEQVEYHIPLAREMPYKSADVRFSDLRLGIPGPGTTSWIIGGTTALGRASVISAIDRNVRYWREDNMIDKREWKDKDDGSCLG